MLEIKVIIDEGGIFQGLYVSPEIKGADVELVDFVTDDPADMADMRDRYDHILQRARTGELVGIQ